MSVVIKYGDFAVGAKEAFNLEATDQIYFSNLQQVKENIQFFPNYGNPIERYSVPLNASVVPLPQSVEGENIGWWSEQISDSEGDFATPIVLEMVSDEYFTSTSITITFDTAKKIYSNDLSISWYRDENLLSEKSFTPTSAKYSCENKVEFYNKVIITFNKLNYPLNRLRVKSVDHGSVSFFNGKNIKKCNISQKINSICTELPIGTGSILLNGENGVEYLFQKRQTISIIVNGVPQNTLFVNKASRKGRNEWEIQAEDYIGILENSNFYGGIYNNENAGTLLSEIFNNANVPFEIESEISSEQLSGYIEFGSCRNALMQVCFATGAIVDASSSNLVKVKKITQEVSQEIENARIMQGLQVVKNTRVTSVSIASHSYKELEEEYIAYDATQGGTGQNLLVVFKEPLHSVTIQNGDLLEFGNNYAIINANEGCVLTGKKYEHSLYLKSKNNPLVLNTDTKNVKSITKATLVNGQNIDKLLELCYNYYSNTDSVHAKIVDRKHVRGGDIIRYGQGVIYGQYKYRQKSNKIVSYDTPVNVGDRISIDTTYQGVFDGVVESCDYSLSGNNIVKNIVVR